MPIFCKRIRSSLNNLKFEIIQKCNSEEELILIVNQNIILYNSLYPNGYNLERSQLNNRILCLKQ